MEIKFRETSANKKQLFIGCVKSQLILVAFAGCNENLLMTSLLFGLYVPGFVWSGRFLSPLKILLQLSMLAVPQVQAVAAAHCPSELTGRRTKLDDPAKTKETFVWIL